MGTGVVELFRGVVRLETELWRRVDAEIKRQHNMPLSWLEFLQTIDATPGCRVLDITRALAITVGGVSKIVDRIERAGLCRREQHPADARSNTISLTDAGVDLLAAANVTFEAVLVDLIGSAAPAAELAQLTGLIQRVRQHLDGVVTDATGNEPQASPSGSGSAGGWASSGRTPGT